MRLLRAGLGVDNSFRALVSGWTINLAKSSKLAVQGKGGSHQLLRVALSRGSDYLLCLTVLNHFALLHHQYFIAQRTHLSLIHI